MHRLFEFFAILTRIVRIKKPNQKIIYKQKIKNHSKKAWLNINIGKYGKARDCHQDIFSTLQQMFLKDISKKM